MRRPAIIGLDPGFASFGLAVLELGATGETVERVDVLRTAKSDKKRNVLATEDNVRRAHELAVALWALLVALRAEGLEVVAICAESMSFPRSSSVAAKMALAWGVVVATAHRANVPILQATPQTVKLAAAGAKTASKVDVEDAVRARYGNTFPGLERHARGLHEHLFDAVASAVACLDEPSVRVARRLTTEAA